MANFRKLLEKLHQYFFGKEEEDDDIPLREDPNHQKVLGRMIDSQHTRPTIIHRYPKEGKFRFPLEVDDLDKVMERYKHFRKKVSAPPSLMNQPEKPLRRFQEEQQQPMKFSNQNFKVRKIPSPVYGFKERELTIHRPVRNVEEKEEVALPQNEEMLNNQEQIVEQNVNEIQKEVRPIPENVQEVTEDKNEADIIETKERTVEKVIEEAEKVSELETKKVNEVPSEGKEPIKEQGKVKEKIETVFHEYQFPPLDLLNKPYFAEEDDSDWIFEQADRLEQTLLNFNVQATVVDVTKGPSVTRFEVQPAPGVKVSKITSLIDDIKLALAAKDIRIEAPIPGKHAIGIEVPNLKSSPVFLYEIISDKRFQESPSPLTVALGLDISGQPIITDLKKMPHGLVAGATGSGKSVCINSILISLLYKATPDQVKLMLVDPKVVELAPYNDLPHLISPVITDAKQATAALKWAVLEMERRYELFSQKGVRDIGRYNEVCDNMLPYIVIVIDELADLMMVSPQEVEESICRIAQKARACGIHLLLATQRPSVDVITGLIKANIPTRIAFSVSSQVDSRTIIDMSGAERLLGRGDMLFHENGSPKPYRVQGTFVSDEEIDRVIHFVKQQRETNYELETEQLIKTQDTFEQDDELFTDACYFVIEQGGASASLLQRKFRIGYNRAARLIDMMESQGIVSAALGSKPRTILMTVQEFEERILHLSN